VVVVAFLATWLATLLAPPPGCAVGTGADLGCARGFQTRETDGRRSFRWTDERAWVALSGLGWSGPSTLSLALAAPRPQGVRQPLVSLRAGSLQASFTAPAAPRRYHILAMPGRPGADTLTVELSSATFVPHGDSRDLGVAVYDLRALPLGGLRLPGLLPSAALAIIGLALRRLFEQRPETREQRTIEQENKRTRNYQLPATSRRPPTVVASIMAVSGIVALALLWIALPGRVVPFLPALAALLALAAWGLPRLGQLGLPGPVWACALGGAALDGLLVAGVVPGMWIVGVLIAQAALAVWGALSLRGRPASYAALLLIALAVRLLALASRLLLGFGSVDPDTELFYNYGRATIELGVPVAEYPSGALLIWALLALPGSRELFALLLPLLNLACELAIVGALAWLGAPQAGRSSNGGASRDDGTPGLSGLAPRPLHSDQSSHQPASLALFYAISPLLIPFWHAKYDPLPAALTLAGLALFYAGRAGWAGAALGLGGAIKWAPWLAAPFIGWHLLRKGASRMAAQVHSGSGQQNGRRARRSGPPATSHQLPAFLISLLAAILAVSLPFALRSWQGFLTPYTVQGARPLIGESIWFLPALLLEPELLVRLAAPWSGVESAWVSPALTLSVQLLALAALGLIQLLRPIDQRRTLALAALAPAAFLLLNRVFSPQYALPISASLLAAGSLLCSSRGATRALILLLALMQAANQLVWPHTRSYWPAASAVMFAAAVGASIWLALRAARADREALSAIEVLERQPHTNR
jgi:hypothetical protein